jgi:rhodanese-related sulfurtransferase
MHTATNPDIAQTSPTDTGFSEISIEDAARLYEEKGAIIADARHATDFEAGHIKAAVNLYSADQDTWLPGFLEATDPATVIITYCDGNDCHLATQLAELLLLNGFERVHYLKNGWTRWREGGYPVE